MSRSNLHIFRNRPKKHLPAFPASYCCDYIASSEAKSVYGDKVTSFICCFTENDMIAIIDSKEDYERFGNMLVDKHFKDPDYLDNLIEWSENNCNLLLDYIENNLGEKVIYDLNNDELAERYFEYCELYRSYHLKNTPPWWIGSDVLLNRIKRYLKERNIDEIDHIISELLSLSEYKSENLKEEVSLLKISELLKKEGIKQVCLEDLNMYPGIKIKFDEYIKDFSSIPFGYNTGVVWDEEYFLKKINNILNDSSTRKKIEDKIESFNSVKNKRRDLEKKFALTREINTYFKNLRQLTYLQDLKKETQTKSHPILQLIVNKEVAKRLNISPDNLNYMSHFEIKDCLIKNEITFDLLGQVQKRMGLSVLIAKDLNYEWLTDKEAEKFLKSNGLIDDLSVVDKMEIEGCIASRGHTISPVSVCKFSTEIEKVKKGDVLVASMTTPDYVPAMKKASAIVTDEGGITCHAAIISREMKKPCIIGTKIATQVLKDGDLVEVDANEGVVRILEKAEGVK